MPSHYKWLGIVVFPPLCEERAFSGMNIIVKTYSDGTRETTKAVK